jgi:hypothetical protein
VEEGLTLLRYAIALLGSMPLAGVVAFAARVLRDRHSGDTVFYSTPAGHGERARRAFVALVVGRPDPSLLAAAAGLLLLWTWATAGRRG